MKKVNKLLSDIPPTKVLPEKLRRPPSLSLRMTLFFGAVAIAVFAGFGWLIEASIQHHFSKEDDAELSIIDANVRDIIATSGGIEHLQDVKQRLQDILVSHHGAVLNIIASDGSLLFASRKKPDMQALSLAHLNHRSTPRRYDWNDGEHAYRVFSRVVPLANKKNSPIGYVISIAVAFEHHQRFLAGFRFTLWTMIVAAISIMSLMGWCAIRVGHAPLRNIIANIRQFSATELNTRLSPDSVPRELTDLAIAFNDMLERMQQSFTSLANFSADIAHELRTPVTNLLTQTQVALSKSRGLEEYREILYSNIEEYERMAQMISDMLFLAKTDNGWFHPDLCDIDLNKEVKELFDYFEAWAEERGVNLSLRGNAITRGDKSLIRRAISNLLANAIKHTAAGQTITVSLSQSEKANAIVAIENPGPTIAPQHLPRLFDRFYRVDASRQRGIEGAGLGLAITKSIVELHGGHISVTSQNDHTCFQIEFAAPAASSRASKSSH